MVRHNLENNDLFQTMKNGDPSIEKFSSDEFISLPCFSCKWLRNLQSKDR